MQLLQYGIQLRDFTPEIGIETSHFRLGAMLQELFVHSISFVAFTGELAIPLLPFTRLLQQRNSSAKPIKLVELGST